MGHAQPLRAEASNGFWVSEIRQRFIIKQNRFNVPVVKAREALDASPFGKLILGTVWVRWCHDQAYYDPGRLARHFGPMTAAC